MGQSSFAVGGGGGGLHLMGQSSFAVGRDLHLMGQSSFAVGGGGGPTFDGTVILRSRGEGPAVGGKLQLVDFSKDAEM